MSVQRRETLVRDIASSIRAATAAASAWRSGCRRGLAIAAVALCGHGITGAAADEARLLYTSIRGEGPEIYLHQAGSPPRQLTRSQGGNEQPAWSPDGSKVAFVSYRDGNGEIYVMDADGSNQTRLTNQPALDTGPKWSPDGRRIAFVSARSKTAQVWVMNANGSDARRVAETPGEQGAVQWSPGGSKLAFLAVTRGKTDVMVADVDGGKAVNLTEAAKKSHSGAAWAPDGTRIAFTRFEGDTVSDIVVAKVDGSGTSNVTNSKSFLNTQPAWSPDGRQIAFLSTRDHPEGTRANAFVMNADGSAAVNVAGQPEIEHMMVNWAADGRRIYFVAVPWGSSQILSARTDGSDRQLVSQGKAFDLDPQPCCARSKAVVQALMSKQ